MYSSIPVPALQVKGTLVELSVDAWAGDVIMASALFWLNVNVMVAAEALMAEIM